MILRLLLLLGLTGAIGTWRGKKPKVTDNAAGQIDHALDDVGETRTGVNFTGTGACECGGD